MMISSAVVVPQIDRSPSPSSPSLKRKSTSDQGHHTKRTKVSSDGSPTPSSDAQIPSLSAAATSPSRRRSSALPQTNGSTNTVTEEKKRNQRLFSSLLGTLSQSSTRPAHKKRDEIEARQRERLRKENEESEARRKKQKEDLARKRSREQAVWDERSRKIRHANMRAQAGFLRTKTKPVLLYLPWELRPEEEDDIERRKEEVEEQIRGELGLAPVESKQAKEHPNKAERNFPNTIDDSQQLAGQQDVLDQQLEDSQSANGHVEREDTGRQHSQPPEESTGASKASLADHEDNHKGASDDQNDEELVEGQEDDVIY